MVEKPSILHVHVGALGDLLLLLPSLRQLRRRYRVACATAPSRIALLRQRGWVDQAMDIETMDLAGMFTTPSPRLRETLRSFSDIVFWMRDDSGTLASTLTPCVSVHVQFFPGIPPQSWSGHAADYYASCLNLPTPVPGWTPLSPPPTQGPVVLHPGSGSPRKNWPFVSFLYIAEKLREQGFPVAWLFGECEHDLYEVHAAALKGQTVFRDLDLCTVAEQLASARLYIGNDSGITHLAAAVGCPTLAVFGATSPARWAPRGEHVHVVGSDAAFPSVEAVWEAVTDRLA